MPAIQLMSVSSAETTQAAEVSTTKTQKLQGLQSTFSNYMRQNSSSSAQTAQGQNTVLQTKQTGSDNQVKQQYEQYQSKSAAQADKVTSSAETSSVDADTVQEAVEETVESIREVIKENLDVSDEQIEAAMELLGLTQTDLLDPQQLIALAVQLTGSEDAGSMLFQENFQIVMQETGVITDDLLQQLGMSMDELMDQVHAMLENTEQPIDTMLPQQEIEAPQQPEQSVQTAQPVQVQAPQQEADAAIQPQREAVQTVQYEETTEAAAKPQQEAQAVQEAKPQETKQVQTVQPAEAQTQTDQQPAWENPADTLAGDSQQQENPHFEFHTNMHAQEPAANVQTPQSFAAETPLPQTNMQDVIDQIVQHTKINLSDSVKSIEMQLNPENLGKVYLHVSEKQGTVTAQLTAQNENMKEALVQQAAILKENLNQQGIKVDAVEVTTGTHEFESNLERDAHSQEEQARQQEEQNMRRSTRSINLNELNDIEGLSGLMSEEETLVAQIMRDNGNNVDFKA